MKKVFVIGAGVMGNGIAQVSAEAGYETTMMDIKDEFVQNGLATIGKNLDRKVKKETITQADKEAVMGRIKGSVDMKDAADADVIIEAAPEVLDLKKSIFKQLDEICKADAILGTNTSSLPVSEIAEATKRPEKVVGIHFMNPVPVIKGVEVIPGKQTAADVLAASKDFIKSLGKEPCEAVDLAGFIVSRLVDVLMNEAIRCIEDGNKPEEIDKAMRLCCNFPIGPLELCDLAGADIVLHGTETMNAEFGERWNPAELLKKQVAEGKLGRKVGKGFYDYTQK